MGTPITYPRTPYHLIFEKAGGRRLTPPPRKSGGFSAGRLTTPVAAFRIAPAVMLGVHLLASWVQKKCKQVTQQNRSGIQVNSKCQRSESEVNS